MTHSTVTTQITAAFAALFTAAVFVAASVGPATQNAAALLA